MENGVGSVPGTLDARHDPGGRERDPLDVDRRGPEHVDLGGSAGPAAGGQSYQASVTLEGTGDVYLDFWNGQSDLVGATIPLTSTPITLTLQGDVPSATSTHLQVRTADAGPIDLYASAASIQQLVPQSGN